MTFLSSVFVRIAIYIVRAGTFESSFKPLTSPRTAAPPNGHCPQSPSPLRHGYLRKSDNFPEASAKVPSLPFLPSAREVARRS
jgi:hypothetical protein